MSLQTSSGFHFCGGSLVRRDVVMTAAHCVEGTSAGSIQAVVGAHNLDATGSGGTVKQVASIVVHSAYNSNSLVNDIALLKLTTVRSTVPSAHPLATARSPSRIAGLA